MEVYHSFIPLKALGELKILIVLNKSSGGWKNRKIRDFSGRIRHLFTFPLPRGVKISAREFRPPRRLWLNLILLKFCYWVKLSSRWWMLNLALQLNIPLGYFGQFTEEIYPGSAWLHTNMPIFRSFILALKSPGHMKLSPLLKIVTSVKFLHMAL